MDFHYSSEMLHCRAGDTFHGSLYSGCGRACELTVNFVSIDMDMS
jgi:hypothetical protein